MRVHVVAWVTWFDKAEKLEFYYDEEDYITTPPMSLNPRRCLTIELEDEYQARLSVTVGTVRGQQEGSQYSRVSDTEGWR